MNLSQVKKMYFLGIGGIGMSALARYFQQQGVEIFGYDLTSSNLTNTLINEGMKIHFADDVLIIPSNIDLAVYTPAIPADLKELVYFKQSKIPLLKRAELVEKISEGIYTVAIGGTHGKTSISAITAHLLKSAGLNLTGLVGGICRNYNSNLILSEKTDYFLIEADEFDRSFLRLSPQIAVVSSTDADHLDIYGSHDELKKTYLAFVSKLKPDGLLVYHYKLKEFEKLPVPKTSYGNSQEAESCSKNIRVEEGKFIFDIKLESIEIENIKMQIPGIHYIENSLAAATVAARLGLNTEQIKIGLESFTGVERRFEYYINTPELVYIDDYAHHPEEIRATIEAARFLYPGRKITGIFQPHLYSRTRDFAKGFAESLDKLDELIILDIYPAREFPMEGVTSGLILGLMKNQNHCLLKKEELIDYLAKHKPDVLLTIGAGDIGMMTNDIKSVLTKK